MLTSILLAMLLAQAAGSDVAELRACGDRASGNRQTPSMRRAESMIMPASLLVYCGTTPETGELLVWDGAASSFFAELGVSVTAVTSEEAVRLALEESSFDVVMLPLDAARRLRVDLAVETSELVLLPILWTPTRSQRRAADSEFGVSVDLPTTLAGLVHRVGEASRR